jgi:hypothetical protein
MGLARWEWAFAAQAVARGDILLLLDDEAASEQRADPGDRLWLLPSWQDERPAAVKRSWWAEVSRSNNERPTDGSVPVRCLCDVVASHTLDDAARARIAPYHPWSREHARHARRALLVRAHARAPRPVAVERGDDTYVELASAPSFEGLLPALTDDAFALHRAEIERNLEHGYAPRA